MLSLCGALAVPRQHHTRSDIIAMFWSKRSPGSQAKVGGGDEAPLQGRVPGGLVASTLQAEPGWPVSLLWSWLWPRALEPGVGGGAPRQGPAEPSPQARCSWYSGCLTRPS